MTADLIGAALQQLSARRPVFHSEADFQHELAVQISRIHPDTEIRLERPVRLPGSRTINLDILLTSGGTSFALELKYVTAKLAVTVNDEDFALKAQSAQDLRRYDILKDIVRIETLHTAGVVDGGMSVTITNDPSLWNETRRAGVVDEMFRLHHGSTLTGNLRWAAHASAGTMRGRETPLSLIGEYAIDWTQYSQVEVPRNGEFRMLVIETTGPAK